MQGAITSILLLLLAACIAEPTLSTFSYSPNPLNTARDGFCLVQYQQWVYAIGGYDGSRLLSSIEQSTLSSSNTLENPFEVSSSALLEARDSHACVVIPPFIYVFGGNTVDGESPTIERASIRSGGSLSSFSTYHVSLPQNVSGASLAYDPTTASLFLSGGYSRTAGMLSIVYKAKVDQNGEVSTFSPESNLVNARYLHRSIVIGGSLIVVGGSHANLEKASISAPEGALSTFDDQQAVLLNERLGLSIGYTDGVLFAVGGTTAKRPYSTVESISITAAGEIQGSFTEVEGVSLQYGRLAHEGGFFGNEYVVVGGAGTTGADILSSVEFAQFC